MWQKLMTFLLMMWKQWRRHKMAKYEILIAGKNEAEDYRKNKFDILAIRQYPWNWGAKEIKLGLVVIVESNKTFEEMRDYESDLWENKSTEVEVLYKDIKGLSHDDLFSTYQFKKKGGYSINYIILKTYLTDLNDSKMENMGMAYQPFKNNAQLIQKFDGKNGNRLIRNEDVDTVSVDVTESSELVIDLNTEPNLIKSNV